MKRKVVNLGLSLIGPVALIILLTMPIGPLAGGLGILQPWGGIFDVGRGLQHPNSETIALPDVITGADVVIDEWGIPHIYSDNLEDAFLALGYMHAKDRLFQIVMQIYLASGRISEVVGGSEQYINADKFHRSIGLTKSAEECYQWYLDNAATNEDVDFSLRCIHAHVEGMNLFIDSMTSETTPIEFKILGFTPQHFTPVDSFIWAKYMTWTLSGGIRDLRNEFIRTELDNDTMYSEIFPEVYPNTTPIIPEQYNLSLTDYADAPGGYPAMIVPPPSIPINEEPTNLIPKEDIDAFLETTSQIFNILGDYEFLGSNSWALNGSKTESGRAMLANDPHLTLQAPSLWYEVHIVVTDEDDYLNIQGGSLPGTPGVLIGHTEHMSWGMTNVGADVLDIFVEELNPSDANQYRYNGEWRNFTTRNEVIKIKGGAEVEFDVYWSVHGPCIDSVSTTYDYPELSHPYLAMNWTGISITHEIMTLGMLNRANNLTDYYDSMYWWDGPPHNFIYADDAGNIAITVAGRFPIRQGYSGNFPVSGLNDSVGMVGNVPYAFNPRSVNPSQCFLQSANQKSIDPSTYSYTILGAQSPDYRGERIHTVLETATDWTVEDMMQLQADVVDLTAQKLLPLVLEAYEGISDNEIDDFIGYLEDWDYKMETDLIAPTIWIYLLDAIRYELFDEVRTQGLSASVVAVPIVEWVLVDSIEYYIDDHTTSGLVEPRDQILVRALNRASDDLHAIDDDITQWTYGLHHIIKINHLAGLTYIGGGPHRGSGYTVNVGANWVVQHGPSRRMIVHYTDTPIYYTVYPGGQSQVMFSKHWDDLFDLWYDFDSVTQTYSYILEHNYTSAEDFQTANDGTMIEYIILFRTRS